MAEVTPALVKRLRDLTGAGMMDCKKALEDSRGDVDKAVLLLRERGIAKAGRREGRETTNGVIEAYLHRTGDYPPQQGTLVELDCESDFVAKGEDFRALAREIAMHVTAANPRWVSREDVPREIVDEELGVYRRQAKQEGKPAAAIEKIVTGKLEAFYKDNCLLDQPYIRDPKTPVGILVKESIAKLQENITVRRFSRFSIKEG